MPPGSAPQEQRVYRTHTGEPYRICYCACCGVLFKRMYEVTAPEPAPTEPMVP